MENTKTTDAQSRGNRSHGMWFYAISFSLTLLALVEWGLLASLSQVFLCRRGEPVMELQKAVVSGHKKDDSARKRLERIAVLRLETHKMSKKLLTEIKGMKEKGNYTVRYGKDTAPYQ